MIEFSPEWVVLTVFVSFVARTDCQHVDLMTQRESDCFSHSRHVALLTHCNRFPKDCATLFWSALSLLRYASLSAELNRCAIHCDNVGVSNCSQFTIFFTISHPLKKTQLSAIVQDITNRLLDSERMQQQLMHRIEFLETSLVPQNEQYIPFHLALLFPDFPGFPRKFDSYVSIQKLKMYQCFVRVLVTKLHLVCHCGCDVHPAFLTACVYFRGSTWFNC